MLLTLQPIQPKPPGGILQLILTRGGTELQILLSFTHFLASAVAVATVTSANHLMGCLDSEGGSLLLDM